MSSSCSASSRNQSDLAYMLRHLSKEEIEIAARTSYEYCQGPPTDRESHAMKMAQRYLQSKGDKAEALAKMKSTIKFRKEMDIDNLLRSAQDPTSDYHIPLRKFLSSKKLYVSGYDREGRSTYIFVPRRVQSHDLEWTHRGHIYNLERAIACSKSPDGTVNAVVDFRGFRVSQAPPMDVGSTILMTLRDHYVGHVNQVFLVNAPLAFLCLWKMFKSFAGRKTRSKIHFLNSDRDKEQRLGKLYERDQVASWMLPRGQKNRDLDVDEFLCATPFDRAFDESF